MGWTSKRIVKDYTPTLVKARDWFFNATETWMNPDGAIYATKEDADEPMLYFSPRACGLGHLVAAHDCPEPNIEELVLVAKVGED
jgi:hypothetical protein